jgi:hypothetical protein
MRQETNMQAQENARCEFDAASVPAGDDLFMSKAEALQTFDAAARRYLKMSGQEFLKKWRAGYFKGKRSIARQVDAVSILLPLVEK